MARGSPEQQIDSGAVRPKSKIDGFSSVDLKRVRGSEEGRARVRPGSLIAGEGEEGAVGA